MGEYILAYDIGTGYAKAALLDLKFNVLSVKTYAYGVYFPKKGYAEQDPLDWWKAVVKTTDEIINEIGVSPKEISALVFTAQMMSTVPVDKDGNPLMRSMIWMDTRAADIAKKIIGSGVLKVSGYNLMTLLMFLRITGGAPGLAGKDVLPKILWVKYNMPDIYEKTYKFLDCKDFLIMKTTGNPVTTKDTAGVTWMMDTRPGRHGWSKKILKKYGVDESKLPDIIESTDIAGELTEEAAEELGLVKGIPVIGGAGDFPSNAVGSGAVKEKEYHIYIGTSILTGAHVKKRITDVSHYMGSILSAIPDRYLFVSEQETGGACLDWVKHNFFRKEEEEMGEKVYELFDEIASKIPVGSEGLIFTPWICGEKTPIDDETVRGLFYNLSAEHTRDHAVRAAMEGVAFEAYWALFYMMKHTGKISWINFVGGGALRRTWAQILADVFGIQVRVTENPREVGVRGAAMIAAVGLKKYRSFEEAAKNVRIKAVYNPNKKNHEKYIEIFKVFLKIYEQNKKIFRILNTKKE